MQTIPQYDRLGNIPRVWVESALDLLTTSAELQFYWNDTVAKREVPFSRSFAPRLMIRAFAVECLLKALILLDGGQLCVSGKLQEKEHNLSKLADRARFALTDKERHVLKKLSAFATGTGRYPIWTRWDRLQRIGGHNDFRADWGSPRDDVIFRSIVVRLMEPFEEVPINRRIIPNA